MSGYLRLLIQQRASSKEQRPAFFGPTAVCPCSLQLLWMRLRDRRRVSPARR
jgi:hypothetical protein